MHDYDWVRPTWLDPTIVTGRLIVRSVDNREALVWWLLTTGRLVQGWHRLGDLEVVGPEEVPLWARQHWQAARPGPKEVYRDPSH